MVDVNSKINREEEKFIKKNSLEALKVVMRNFPNIRGVALIPSEHHAQVADGLCISVKVNVHELSAREKQTLKRLGLTVPLLDKFGNEVVVERINFDKNDIKKLLED